MPIGKLLTIVILLDTLLLRDNGEKCLLSVFDRASDQMLELILMSFYTKCFAHQI